MCVVEEWQNRKNDSNNSKLTKRKKSDESTTKAMFHEESYSVAVYREAEEEASHISW